jgi:hypothetical protein
MNALFALMERLQADDIARAVAFVMVSRRGVAVNEVLIRPAEQQQYATDRPGSPARLRILPAASFSLLRRLEVATQRIRELETDNKRLRHALAEALGERRAINARDPGGTRRHHELPGPRTHAERHAIDTVHDTNQQVTS